MKIYKVTADNYDYDQFDAFIVRAENEEAAKEMALYRADYRHIGNDYQGWSHVEEILTEGESEIILGSFNAG